ncbi:MAG TPA: DUF349 domain-containing protein [Sporichthyaceae bacterium]|nr:DUF349 domain-containing protein [Sporichthyaceae bacterium]
MSNVEPNAQAEPSPPLTDEAAESAEAVPTEPTAAGESPPAPQAQEPPEQVEQVPAEPAAPEAEAAPGESPHSESAAVSPAEAVPTEPTAAAESPPAPQAQEAPEQVAQVPAVPAEPAAPEAEAAPTESPHGEAAHSESAAVSPAEAMAFHRAPAEALTTDLAALLERVAAKSIGGKEAGSRLETLRNAVAALPAPGAPEALTEALAATEQLLNEHIAEQRAARAAATAAARETKTRIVAEAEEIAASDQWRVGSERLPVLLEEWKSCARLDRKTDDELWKRFSSARSLFAKRRKSHYNELNAGRTASRSVKEELVARAEQLSSSTDWAGTAAAYRSMMAEWKAAGRAGREVDDELWARFRSAQDNFFAGRNAALGAREAEQSSNVTAKEELLAEAERLLPVTDPKSARGALRSIVDRWNAVGPVPAGVRAGLEARLTAVENSIRGSESSVSSGRHSPARARAEETVAALRASIATLENKGEKARAAGDDRRAKEAEEGAAARREWLAEAERTLAELS